MFINSTHELIAYNQIFVAFLTTVGCFAKNIAILTK